MYSIVISITKEHIKNEESHAPLQTSRFGIYILTTSAGEPLAHFYLRSIGQCHGSQAEACIRIISRLLKKIAGLHA